ncbi:HEPACAM family member 2-like [Archocentrus centrarchus]|uniref:HEPACAM family member 2-like n=1 Tax=Archocentrus centrarchus TaxID=63155 RepID=UPI0011EA49DD|nr:HEPACAM family member 2-like [Archocentrus centrarchus]
MHVSSRHGKNIFFLYFTAGLLCCICTDEGKTAVKAKERANVTLQTRENLTNAQIMWTFGSENPNMLLATVKKREMKSDYDERFRDRLQLDSQTGALTITQLRVLDSGIYMWQAIGNDILLKQFNLTVYSSVASPSITVSSSLISKSCSSVTVECSAHNSQDLILSWYKGEGRLKNTSSPDLSSRLYLPLEIESHDKENYSCVAENPVEKKTTKLTREDTNLKIESGEPGNWCQTEATVRLVISAVFGMALIILVVDHIRLRR